MGKKKKNVESISVTNPLNDGFDDDELADAEDGEEDESRISDPISEPMTPLTRAARKNSQVCGVSESMAMFLIAAVTAGTLISMIYFAMLATNPDDDWSTDVPVGAMYDVTADPNQGR